MDGKPIVWVDSALEDLRKFPEDARRRAGYQIRRVQLGMMPDDWKPMATVGPGVCEIRIHTKLEHRVLYLARREDAVYVLHAFEKKSRKTSRAALETARRRLSDVMGNR